MSEDDRNIITNTLLHDLAPLGTWLSNRVRNYVQTRHRGVAAHMGITKDWENWFHDQKDLKERLHKKFHSELWIGDRPVSAILKIEFYPESDIFLFSCIK